MRKLRKTISIALSALSGYNNLEADMAKQKIRQLLSNRQKSKK